MTIEALLSAPPSPETGQALLTWAEELHGRILSGEMMIGLLSVAEVERAPQALQKAIDCGLSDAWLALANWQAAPPFGEPYLKAAIVTLQAAIAAGVPGAPLRLAEVQWFYRREDASAVEQAEAHGLVKALVEADPANAVALYHLGLLTCQGFGITADPAQAAAMHIKAAALGNASAMFEAYIYYETATGVEKESAQAFKYLEQAAHAGHPRALYNMGAACATGNMVPRDMARAAEWYQKASNAGNLRATVTLATMYATGDGVNKDLDYAGELFDQAEYMGVDVSERKEAVGLGGAPQGPPPAENTPSQSKEKKSPWWKFQGAEEAEAMQNLQTDWNGSKLTVTSVLLPKILWQTASIDVFIDGECILRTGGQLKLTGSHSGHFDHAGNKT